MVLLTTLITLSVLALCALAVGASVHEQNIQKTRSRRKDLLSKQSKAIRAIDDMLLNSEGLPISHLTYALLHRRMLQSLEFSEELAAEMHLSNEYIKAIRQKSAHHEQSYRLHAYKANGEDFRVTPIDICVPDINLDRNVHAAYRLSRVLRRSSAISSFSHERVKAEIEHIESVAAFYNCLKSKFAADHLFEREHYSDAKPLYQKILTYIQDIVPEHHRHLFLVLKDACHRKLESIAIFDVRTMVADDLNKNEETDGLERFFSTQKQSFY